MTMALCPECGNDVSDKAPSCPHCGIIYNYEDSPWKAISARLAKILNIFLLLATVLGYAHFSGVEFMVAQNEPDMLRGLVLLSVMTESSPSFVRDGYFWNNQIFLLLVDNTYYGFAFGEGVAVSVPAVQAILQSMYVFVLLLGLVFFLLLLSIIKLIFGR